MKFSVLFSFFIMMIMASCNQDHTVINYFSDPIAPEMDTMFWQKGSYWIYRNQTDSAIDCVYVTQTILNSYKVDYVQSIGVIREYFKMVLRHTKDNSDQTLWIESSRMVENPAPILEYAVGPILYSSDTANDWKHTQHLYIDTLIVAGTTWTHVQKTNDSEGAECFVVKGTGIVLDSRNDKIWELIRFDLKRSKSQK